MSILPSSAACAAATPAAMHIHPAPHPAHRHYCIATITLTLLLRINRPPYPLRRLPGAYTTYMRHSNIAIYPIAAIHSLYLVHTIALPKREGSGLSCFGIGWGAEDSWHTRLEVLAHVENEQVGRLPSWQRRRSLVPLHPGNIPSCASPHERRGSIVGVGDVCAEGAYTQRHGAVRC